MPKKTSSVSLDELVREKLGEKVAEAFKGLEIKVEEVDKSGGKKDQADFNFKDGMVDIRVKTSAMKLRIALGAMFATLAGAAVWLVNNSESIKKLLGV